MLTNSTDQSFVGAKFWVVNDAKSDGSIAYQLYSDAGTTGTGIYVKIYATQPKRTLSITVDDGSDPVSGATVAIGDNSKSTGSAGGCTLQNISDGENVVNISKDGFETKTETIIVSADNTSFSFSLTAL